jgi:tetratricopeptide (TPR) repeat protein
VLLKVAGKFLKNLIVFSAFSLFLSGVGEGAGKGWICVSSPEAEVCTDGAKGSAERVLRRIEESSRLWDALVPPGAQESTGGLRVFVLSRRRDWLARSGRGHQDGVYYFDGRRDWIAIREGALSLDRVAAHEYAHYRIRTRLRPVPLWVNEGLAEYLSTFRRVGDRFEVGSAREEHVAHLNRNGLRRVDLQGRDAVSFYPASWALVHLLVSESKRLTGLDEVQGDAWDRVSPQKVEAYVRQADFRTWNVPAKPVGTLSWKVAEHPDDPAMTRDALAATGGLVRPEKLEEFLDPKRLEGKVSKGSANADDLFQLAMLRRETGDEAEYRRLLQQAAALPQTLPEVLMSLAAVELRAGRTAEAVEQLEKLVSLHPDYQAGWETIAMAQWQIGRREAARRSAAEAARRAKDEEEKRRALALIESLQDPVVVERKPSIVRSSKPLESVEGWLEQVDCLGNRARLTVRTKSGKVRLLVSDAGAVNGGSRELACGEAKSVPVKIEFAARSDEALGTAGDVRSLVFP